MGSAVCTNYAESTTCTLGVTSCERPKGVNLGFIGTYMFIDQWGNKTEDLMWDVVFCNTGQLNIAVGISNEKNHGDCNIEVEIGDKVLDLYLNNGYYYEECTRLEVGSINVDYTGHYTVRLRAIESEEGAVGRLYFVELSGEASKGLKNKSYFHISPSSVSLHWCFDLCKVDMLYSEVRVNGRWKDDTLLVVFGFNRVYIGLRKGEIIVGATNECSQDNKENVNQKVYCIKHIPGAEVMNKNDDTEMECSYTYDWKPNQHYKFLLMAKPSQIDKFTIYSAYFQGHDSKTWNFIASVNLYNYETRSVDVYSSIEECEQYHGHNLYEAAFGPLWKRVRDEGWSQVTEAEFRRKGTGWPCDINAGVTQDQRLFLETGGCIEQKVATNTKLFCKESGELPTGLKNINSDINNFSNGSI